MKSWDKFKGIETQFELAGEFELSQCELPGFSCISIIFRFSVLPVGCDASGMQLHIS